MRKLRVSLFLYTSHRIYSGKSQVQCNKTEYGEPRSVLMQSPSFPPQKGWGGIKKTLWTAYTMIQRHTRAQQEKLFDVKKSQQHKGITTPPQPQGPVNCTPFKWCINPDWCTNGKRLLETLGSFLILSVLSQSPTISAEQVAWIPDLQTRCFFLYLLFNFSFIITNLFNSLRHTIQYIKL